MTIGRRNRVSVRLGDNSQLHEPAVEQTRLVAGEDDLPEHRHGNTGGHARRIEYQRKDRSDGLGEIAQRPCENEGKYIAADADNYRVDNGIRQDVLHELRVIRKYGYVVEKPHELRELYRVEVRKREYHRKDNGYEDEYGEDDRIRTDEQPAAPVVLTPGDLVFPALYGRLGGSRSIRLCFH